MTEAARTNGDSLDSEAIDFARIYVFDTETVSPQTQEIARKNQSVILRNCREGTAGATARAVGMSDSSFSRWLNTGPMAVAALILAQLGLKVVPADAVVFIQPEEFN